MAKNRGSKEGFTRDPSMGIPSEQKTSESNKQKIAKIHDMFPDATKDNIAKILQFYEDDESKAVDAITRDGGCEALSNWADSGLKSRNTKNKKKKRKSKRDCTPGITATASFDADDSSSLHSGCNVDIDIEKEGNRTENENGILAYALDEPASMQNDLSNYEHLNSGEDVPVSYSSEKEIVSHKPELVQEISTIIPPAGEELVANAAVCSNCDRSDAENVARVPRLSDSSEKPDEQSFKRDKYRSTNDNYSKYQSRQRTNSFRHSKSSSISEDQSIHYNPQAAAVPTKRGYDKCKKDLNRQTISLQRIHTQLEKGFEDSSKRVKNLFTELQTLLDNRFKDIEAEMEKTKIEAFNLLKSRQDLAVELKRRVDRTLTEAEWTELRSDVKQFVTERKYDDDLGKTIWFHWTDITEVFKSFGEVHPVKNVYSQRSHSALGNSGNSNNPEPSPSSSLANEEIQSLADKNDVGNILDAVEDDTPSAGKEEVPTFTKNQPTENRPTRVYTSSKHWERSSRGGRFPNHRGFFRGNNRGAGYQYSNYRNNNYYRHSNFNNFEDHRNRPHQERINEAPVYSGDRNMNSNPRDFKMNRNQGRGHANYNRYNNNRYRGNPGGQRHVNNNNPENEQSINTPPVANAEKLHVVNGLVYNP